MKWMYLRMTGTMLEWKLGNSMGDKSMKKRYLLSALLCASVFSFTSCVEEIFEAPVPAKDGDEIVFGVRAGFENSGATTKTVYSGVTYDDGDKTFERIDWVDDEDAIQIHCPEALAVNTSNYYVHHKADPGKSKDYAYISKIEDSSLQWNGDGVHNFYAMYPSQIQFEEMGTTLQQGIRMDGTTLRGIVPAAQPTTPTQNGLHWVAAPDMKYAYMAAKSSARRTDGAVSLTFVPIVTAVQIELTLSSGDNILPVSIAEIQIEGPGIAGAFTADLSDTGWPSTSTYPTCTNDATGNDIITISTWYDSKPITVAAGGSLTFTVFLRPGADYSNLKVSYSPTGSGYLGKTMGGSGDETVSIPRNLKTVIKGVKLPAAAEAIEIDASKWMSQLDETTQMKKLSLPGTGGSFSYNYTSSDPGWYKQQTLTLNEQWAAGIRAFEIVSDRPSSSETSLGGQYVKCNKVSMEVTVLAVLEQLLDKVKTIAEGETGQTECAVLILTYQPEGVWGNSRNASSYAASLKLMYEGLTDAQKKQIIQYTPDLTLADAKGKVMIFCRINQKDEPEDGNFADATNNLAGTNITLIDGCGTGKDRWGSRGYKVQGNVAYDAAHTDDATRSVDYYLKQTGGVGNFQWPDWYNDVTVPVAENGDLNFSFSTNYDAVQCWYQEWARVVPKALTGDNPWYQIDGAHFITQLSAHSRWFESYNEKLEAAKKTFEMAISGSYPNYVFINSLCGYFVDSGIESSYTVFTGSNTGGIAGNIQGLADKLNPDFYQYVLQAGLDQATGPTGIVMMDYVTNTPNPNVEFDGSYLLPGVIISNNFKFGSGNAGSNGGGNTGGNTGGDSGSGDSETPGEGGEGEDGI